MTSSVALGGAIKREDIGNPFGPAAAAALFRLQANDARTQVTVGAGPLSAAGGERFGAADELPH